MSAENWGREVVSLVELDQPLCTRTYGSSPCAAVLGTTGTRKCYNTRATCQDPANYSAGTLTLKFSRPQPGLDAYGYVIPCVRSLDTSSGAVNFGGMDKDTSPLGAREVVSIECDDFQHSDLLVDPYRLERNRTAAEYLELAAIGDYASTPDTAALSFTGAIDIRVKFSGDWTPAAESVLISKRGTLAADKAWSIRLTAITGVPRFTYTKSPSTEVIEISTVGHGFVDGSTHWLRVTCEPAATTVTKFWTSDDGVAWTQLGADRNEAGADPRIETGSSPISIGASNGDAPAAGKYYYAEVRNGVAGTVVATFDAADGSIGGGSTFTSGDTGETWTLSGSAVFGTSLTGLDDPFDPYERGTFWGKWLARNPYHSGAYALRVREGYVGDTVGELRTRHYVVDRVERPSSGRVRITAKDIFSLAEAAKAKAPTPSRGYLAADMTSSQTTFSVSGYLPEDYPINAGSPSSLFVAIGDEVIECYPPGSPDGDFAVRQRGALNTTADSHNSEDAVQWVLTYNTVRAHEIIYDLLTNYTPLGAASGSPSSDYIVLADWAAAAATLTALYTARIASPTAVQDLVGELALQAGLTLHANPQTRQIELRALRPAASRLVVTDDDIARGSISLKQKTDRRVSEVWLYYAQKSPTADLTDAANYRSRLVSVDADAEAVTQYGAPQIREVFSRWIPQFGRSMAETAADRLLAMFRDPPTQASFRLHVDRLDDVGVTDYIALSTLDVQDDSGATAGVQHGVVSIERGENEIGLTTQSVVFESAENDSGEIVIYIENDSNNLSLREIWDLLYAAPAGGSPTTRVRFIVENGVVVGSSTTASAALRTGTWPSGVALTLEVQAGGVISGKPGAPGSGGSAVATGGTASLTSAGSNGEDGGPAILAEATITIDNAGAIYGGGGGGGGGGAATDHYNDGVNSFSVASAGGGGGGGRGANGATAGGAGFNSDDFRPSTGSNAANGTSGAYADNGVGGAGAAITASTATATGGAGGDGGDFGLDGANGTAGSTGGGAGATSSAGGTGGSAGYYIVGNSYVTWLSPTGTVLGRVSA